QAEDGIRDFHVTGVQTCALPIYTRGVDATVKLATAAPDGVNRSSGSAVRLPTTVMMVSPAIGHHAFADADATAFGSRRSTLVRSTLSCRDSWRSSSLTASGSAKSSSTA